MLNQFWHLYEQKKNIIFFLCSHSVTSTKYITDTHTNKTNSTNIKTEMKTQHK